MRFSKRKASNSTPGCSDTPTEPRARPYQRWTQRIGATRSNILPSGVFTCYELNSEKPVNDEVSNIETFVVTVMIIVMIEVMLEIFDMPNLSMMMQLVSDTNARHYG